MKIYLISFLFIIAHSFNAFAAPNIIYDFEDDRNMKKLKNVTYVQPESEYRQKKIDEIELRCKTIEGELTSLNDDVKKLRETVHDLESRLTQAQNRIK